jgi:hypothetical protein
MEVSSLGDNLAILIKCDHAPHHDWMSFFCWYSISKNLPEAKVIVACSRGGEMNFDIFNWPKRCGVQFAYHNPGLDTVKFVLDNDKFETGTPLLVLEPCTACLRDFDEAQFDQSTLAKNEVFKAKELSGLVSETKDENPSVFTDYSNGWGKFVTSSWINKASTPLVTGLSFFKPMMSVNESRLGKLWDRASLMYQSVSRG